MKRLERLSTLWGWLPAFRAVAEVGGVRRAATILRTSPSALSRAVSQLEQEVGAPLFERGGQKLVLTRAGSDLLARTREAMRRIDDVLSASPRWDSYLLMGTNHPWLLAFVEDAVVELATAQTDWSFEASLVGTDDAAAALTSGRIDIGLFTMPVEHASVETVAELKVELGVFAPREHALAARPAPLPVAELSEHHFVAPTAGPDFDSDDGFPKDVTRRVRVSVASMAAAARAATGGLLVVLPRNTARATARDRGKGLVEIATTPELAPLTWVVSARKGADADAIGRAASSLKKRLGGAP